MAKSPATAALAAVCMSVLVLTIGGTSAEAAPSLSGHNGTFYLNPPGSLQVTGVSGAQLGIGSLLPRSVFHLVAMDPAPTHVWAGPAVTFVRRADGTLWASGSSSDGLLGNGGTTNSSTTFAQVGTDTDWKEVFPGRSHVVAIKNDGSLWAWGGGMSGALGVGYTTFRLSAPTRVGTTSDWLTASAGWQHTLAIKTDGTLWAWGNHTDGKLGIGTATGLKDAPVKVGTLGGWKSVAAGQAHSLAIREDGSLWAWGNNFLGQLGTGDNVNSNIPVRVGTGNQWKAVRAGMNHSLGQLTDNTLRAWGLNDLGQLGVGNTANRTAPTPLASGGSWQTFHAGANHSAGVRTDGTLAVWGSNTWGQLGPAPAVVTSPQNADISAVPDIAASRTATSDVIETGSTPIIFPRTAEESPGSLQIHLQNLGTAALSIPSIVVPAGFTVNPSPPFSLQPGQSQPLTITLDATVTGELSRTLTIQSNDPDEVSFHITLSGHVLSRADDTDGDGLNDASEFLLSGMGFNWNFAQPGMVTTFLNGASRQGMFLLPSAGGNEVLTSRNSSGPTSIILGLQESADLAGFRRKPFLMSEMTPDGSIEFTLSPEATSAFFRFSLEPLPSPANP